ncbi:hypothetical protein POTOM_050762 [Populus tomentosa]|uniref:Uncharacterized protein n=1 Tax=Populus tomentosa TaxID=118781 RepID=A0A8X7YB08_POPTO|nr:hypothetical protein POTOM_050762 [Populus tomentosa]
MANAKPCKSKVQDKVAIVTGGASGLGEATVLAFVENGARGVVIADIQDEKGQKLAESIGTNRSTYIHCDVTDENQVKSLVESTVQLYGQLDIVFCNAGIMSFGKQTVLDFDLDSYDKLFVINVRGVAACLKHAARAMVEGGPVATPLACKKMNMGVEEAEEAFEPHYCLKGVLKAKHVADAVLFLASEDSEFVTGHNLVVDGGYNFQAPNYLYGPVLLEWLGFDQEVDIVKLPIEI